MERDESERVRQDLVGSAGLTRLRKAAYFARHRWGSGGPRRGAASGGLRSAAASAGADLSGSGASAGSPTARAAAATGCFPVARM